VVYELGKSRVSNQLLIKTFWQSKKKDRVIATLYANVKSLTAKDEEMQEELKKTAPQMEVAKKRV